MSTDKKNNRKKIHIKEGKKNRKGNIRKTDTNLVYPNEIFQGQAYKDNCLWE